MQVKLTKRVVDALQSRGDEVRIWDVDIRGFGVRCRGLGGKYYFLKYRLSNGRQRWATIGRHGSPWTVETARKEARRLLPSRPRARRLAASSARSSTARIRS